MEKERQRMEAEGRRMRGEPEPDSQPTLASTPAFMTRQRSQQSSDPSISVPSSPERSTHETLSRTTTANSKRPRPPKDRMFCTLPPKDKNGERDPTWVRVFMQDVDEVGAHCGLFFVDERYERLVGDVASRIEGWVKEDSDGRWVKEMSAGGYARGEKGGWDLD